MYTEIENKELNISNYSISECSLRPNNILNSSIGTANNRMQQIVWGRYFPLSECMRFLNDDRFTSPTYRSLLINNATKMIMGAIGQVDPETGMMLESQYERLAREDKKNVLFSTNDIPQTVFRTFFYTSMPVDYYKNDGSVVTLSRSEEELSDVIDILSKKTRTITAHELADTIVNKDIPIMNLYNQTTAALIERIEKMTEAEKYLYSKHVTDSFGNKVSEYTGYLTNKFGDIYSDDVLTQEGYIPNLYRATKAVADFLGISFEVDDTMSNIEMIDQIRRDFIANDVIKEEYNEDNFDSCHIPGLARYHRCYDQPSSSTQDPLN